MGVQKKIITGQGATITPVSGKSFAGAYGKLAIGKPGDITSREFGPIVKTEVLSSDATFGKYVSGKGVLVNSNDVANMANFDKSYLAKAGQAAGFLTYGTCVAWRSDFGTLTTASTGMNAKIVYGDSAASSSGTGTLTALTDANWATFAAKVSEVEAVYVFTATVAGDTTTWKLVYNDGVEDKEVANVTLSDYGITFASAANGDKITVDFHPLCEIEVLGFKA